MQHRSHPDVDNALAHVHGCKALAASCICIPASQKIIARYDGGCLAQPGHTHPTGKKTLPTLPQTAHTAQESHTNDILTCLVNVNGGWSKPFC